VRYSLLGLKCVNQLTSINIQFNQWRFQNELYIHRQHLLSKWTHLCIIA